MAGYSMSRMNRLRDLGAQLLGVMSEMGDRGTYGADAVVFLDLLRRCQAFSSEEILDAGVLSTVSIAENLRVSNGAALGEIALSVLEIDTLIQRAYEFADPEGKATPDKVDDLACRTLRLATIAEYLPDSGRAKALGAIEQISSLVFGNPESFEDARGVGEDRELYEHPSRLPEPARELVDLLRATTQLADYDAATEYAPVPQRHLDLAKRLWDEHMAKKKTSAGDAE